MKPLNALRRKPFALAWVLISVFFFSIFLTFAYPPSIAFANQVFLPVVFKAIDITLAWDHNSEPDLAGYKLYIGKSSRNYAPPIDLGLTTQYTIRNLIAGTTYYFTLTAYNQKGLESSFSNEVRYP